MCLCVYLCVHRCVCVCVCACICVSVCVYIVCVCVCVSVCVYIVSVFISFVCVPVFIYFVCVCVCLRVCEHHGGGGGVTSVHLEHAVQVEECKTFTSSTTDTAAPALPPSSSLPPSLPPSPIPASHWLRTNMPSGCRPSDWLRQGSWRRMQLSEPGRTGSRAVYPRM